MAAFDAILPPFDVASSTILITGGRSTQSKEFTLSARNSFTSLLTQPMSRSPCDSAGIGLGLVDELAKRGAKLLITGRREAELQNVQANYPQHVLKYYVSDAGKEADRISLFEQSTADYPQLNVLVNNAGIQRRTDHTKEIHEAWAVRQAEIDTNYAAPVHLTSLFLPHLLTRPQAAVIYITGGVAFLPVSAFPVYSGTKAALHQYAASLRPLLAESSVRVVEAIPPAVKSGLHPNFGEECDEYCRSVVDSLVAGKQEFGFKMSEEMRLADRQWLQQKAADFNAKAGLTKFQSLKQ